MRLRTGRVRNYGNARVREWFGAAVASFVAASVAGAQVGTVPSKSPFQDIERRHEITPFFGYFSAKKDPGKVAPQSAPMAGLSYEWRASGPVNLGLNLMAVNSERTQLDPSKSVSGRVVGTTSEPLYGAEGFLAVALTGERSWHHLMPMTGVGLGIITNGKGADVGGFRFGTRFALPLGAGVRWIPGGGPLQMRADIKDWMYTIKYPQAYYTPVASGEDPILAGGTKATRWTHNFAMTVGLSYTFKR